MFVSNEYIHILKENTNGFYGLYYKHFNTRINFIFKAPSKFRTKGQVISYKPKSISKFVKGICSNCKKA